MKTLQVIDTLGRGGAEQALLNLLPSLRKVGVESHIAVLRPPYPLQEAFEANGIKVHRLVGAHKWRLKANSREVESLAEEIDADAVHAHLYFPGLYVAMGRGLQRRRRARLITFHNLAYSADRLRKPLKSQLRKKINRWVIRRGIGYYTAVSHAAAEHYQRELGLPPVDVIPNAVPTESIRPNPNLDTDEVRQSLDAAGNARLIVCPGRLVVEKGHADLLSAAKLLRDRGERFQLRIIGDGPLADVIDSQINSLGLSSTVRRVAAVPHDRLLNVMQAADCVVVPSRVEGFGLVAAEAMAMERPVVATRIGGLVDLVEGDETGLLVAAEAPAELADAIHRLLTDSSLAQELAIAGRRSIEASFSAAAIARRWADYYREATEELQPKCPASST